jgi:hypothetical protein
MKEILNNKQEKDFNKAYEIMALSFTEHKKNMERHKHNGNVRLGCEIHVHELRHIPRNPNNRI